MNNHKYKCKICGWRGRILKITTEKEFNIECKTFTHKDVLCPSCGYRGIVERDSKGCWALIILILILILLPGIGYIYVG